MPIKKILTFLFLAKSLFGAYAATATISISHLRAGSADLVNFPMLIAGIYPKMATVANGGLVTSSNGYDIVFTSDAACSNKLNWETEYWDATGKVVYDVRIPLISHTVDNTYYVCVGNGAVTTDQSNRAGTWDSNYLAVYHFGVSALSLADSTANAKTLTNSGATFSSTGAVGGALAFNGNAYAAAAFAPSAGSDYTVETWFQSASFCGGCYQTMVDFGNSPSNENTYFAMIYGNSYTLEAGFYGDDFFSNIPNLSANTWYWFADSQGGLARTQYLNGSQVNSATAQATYGGNSNGYLGVRADLNIQQLNGVLDEVRISNIARASNWIAADYANQSNPASFYSLNFPVPGAIPTGKPILW